MSTPRGVRLQLGLLLRQSHRRASAALDAALAPLGLTGRHFGVLLLLDQAGVSTQRDLIQQTGSDKAGMVRTVELLEELGYLRRTPSSTDKRVAELTLTEAGAVAFDKARQLAGKVADQLFDAFTPAELTVLEDLLDRFVHAGRAKD
jgi:MarR family transcriptional regulator, lower aerobic nicotinate degradation pathway regulator